MSQVIKGLGTIFINSENSKTYYHHRLLFDLVDQVNLKRSDKYVYSANVNISTPTWNGKFELPDGC